MKTSLTSSLTRSTFLKKHITIEAVDKITQQCHLVAGDNFTMDPNNISKFIKCLGIAIQANMKASKGNQCINERVSDISTKGCKNVEADKIELEERVMNNCCECEKEPGVKPEEYNSGPAN